jgi:outer membrane protein assembly factor BamB
VAADVPLIDLDVAPPRPAGDRADRRRARTSMRPLLVLAVAALALAVLGPAAPPAPRMRLVLAAGGTAAAAFTLGRDALYTASYGVTNPNSESGIRRFDLRDGSLRWAASVNQNVQNVVVNDDAGVLMARSGSDPRISFLDSRTGTLLWRSEQANTAVLGLTRRGVLISTDVPGGTRLRLADAHTGRSVWSRTVDERVMFGPDDVWSGDPARVVVISLAGTVVTLDAGTGAVLGGGDFGVRLRRAETLTGDSASAATVGGDRMVVRRRSGGRNTLTAYALTPFARLWERDDGAAGFAADCGGVWCVARQSGDVYTEGGPADAGVDAVDPADGRLRWRAPGLGFAGRMGRFVIAGDTQEEPEISLLDPATGRPVRRLGRVIRIDDLLLRRDAAVAGTTWVGTLDDAGAWHVLGRVDSAAAYGCERAGRHLACPSDAGPTKVWRLP